MMRRVSELFILDAKEILKRQLSALRLFQSTAGMAVPSIYPLYIFLHIPGFIENERICSCTFPEQTNPVEL